MWKYFWWGGGVALFLAVAAVWAANTSTFLYRHPSAPNIRVVVDKRTGQPVVESLIDPTKPALLGATAPEPRALVAGKEHHFGVMDPDSKGEHQFQVKNAGTAPLDLKIGPTTCKCTVSGLSNNQLLPGEIGFVRLEWNTGRKHLTFAQSAVVYTNDPLAKEIELSVTGKVRMQVGLDRSLITMAAVAPDRPVSAEVLVYSQIWPSLEVAAVTGKLPGLKWTAETIDPALAPQLDARAVQKLSIEFQQPVSQGQFDDSVRIEVRPPESEDGRPQYLDLAVAGSVMQRFAIYGPAIDSSGRIDLGTVKEGVGKRVKLLVKVRDAQTDLGQTKVVVSPSLLNVQLTPRSEGAATGLYDLVVELPAGVAPCQYLADPVGRLEIITNHPRIGTVELMVSFAVLPRDL